MRLICAFEMVDMGNEIIAVPVGKNAERVKGVLKLNSEGREIVTLLSKDTSIERITEALSAKYDNDRDVLLKYVNDIVEKLKKADLIES